MAAERPALLNPKTFLQAGPIVALLSRGRIQHSGGACLSESDPPKKKHRTRCSLWNADIYNYLKWGPDQIRDQNTTPSPTMPRSQG